MSMYQLPNACYEMLIEPMKYDFIIHMQWFYNSPQEL